MYTKKLKKQKHDQHISTGGTYSQLPKTGFYKNYDEIKNLVRFRRLKGNYIFSNLKL